MFVHAEEDVDTRSNRAGCFRLRLKVRDRFPSNCILLVVQGKDDLGGLLEIFDWGDSWEESIPNKEDEVQERPEVDCSTVAGALGVFKRPESEVEA